MSAQVKEKKSLDRLERWFQFGVVGPHETRSHKAFVKKFKASSFVLASKTLTPEQRLRIYSQMYFLRLCEALESDYPTVRHLLGEEKFQELAREYLLRFPSRNYSLSPLGRKLPLFLKEKYGKEKRGLARKELLLDVARLEFEMQEVFDEAEGKSLKSENFAAFPASRWDRAVLKFIPAFRLLVCDYPVNAIVSAVKQEKPLPKLAKKKSWVAVYRKQFVVWRLDLSEPMFVLMKNLASGKTVLKSILAARRIWKGSAKEFEQKLFTSLREWASEGLFAEIKSK